MHKRVFAAAVFGLLLVSGGLRSVRADESARALRLPPLPGVDAPFWLVAEGFALGETVEITLTTPDGLICAPVDVESGEVDFAADDLGVVEAVVAPAACVGVEVPGQWVATFEGEDGRVALASFVLIEPNQIRSVPFAPSSASDGKEAGP